MKAPVYKIICKKLVEAIVMFEALEERDLPMDCRDGTSVIFSKEWLDQNGVSEEDLRHQVEDVCAVYEFDYTPDIEIVEDYEFDDETRNWGSTI